MNIDRNTGPLDSPDHRPSTGIDEWTDRTADRRPPDASTDRIGPTDRPVNRPTDRIDRPTEH
jgi:hypothetical protein